MTQYDTTVNNNRNETQWTLVVDGEWPNSTVCHCMTWDMTQYDEMISDIDGVPKKCSHVVGIGWNMEAFLLGHMADLPVAQHWQGSE